jgi:hypothetical protein
MKYCIPLCFLFILLISGCKKHNSQPSFAFSDLQFKQGNTWTYSRYDATPNIRDTVTITIPAVYTKNDTTTYLWVQTLSGISDTAFWFLHNDTLYGQAGNSTDAEPLFYEIVFPLSAGSNWYDGLSLGSDSLISQLKVNNTSYNNIYQVHWQDGIYTDFPTFENIYFVKGIGMIRYNQNTSLATYSISNLASTNYQWDLISYHLNK